MSNVTISLDEQLLAKSKAYARKHDTTFNGFVRSLLVAATKNEGGNAGAELAELARGFSGNSGGWSFDRREIYGDRS